jgi:hypothetical protein
MDGRFGAALAMGADLLVVGAPEEGVAKAGAAYRFEYIANSDTFLAPTAIVSSIAAADNRFGSAVAISGSAIVIGSPKASTTFGAFSGAASLFRRPSPGGAVIESVIFVPDAGTDQGSGQSVSTNGEIIVVGAPAADDGLGKGQGRVYVYELKPSYTGPESPMQQLLGIGTATGDNFGSSVSVNTRRAIVGSPLRDLVLENATPLIDVGQGDPFILDAVFKSGFE